MIKLIITLALTTVLSVTNTLYQSILSEKVTIEEQITDVEKYKELHIDSLNEQDLIVTNLTSNLI